MAPSVIELFGMDTSPGPVHPSRILIANDDEWSVRSLETILEPAGHSIIRAFDAASAISAAVAEPPDAVLVAAQLPDRSGLEVCRALTRDPRIRSNTAILLTSVDAVAHARRIAALETGAWEVLRLPVDARELRLRLGTFVRAKHDADRRRGGPLIDPDTGLYSLRGLVHRATELILAARRYRRSIACIVFGLGRGSPGGAPPIPPDEVSLLGADLARTLTRTARGSDIVARVAPLRFALLAYDADHTGARTIAERVLRLLDDSVADESTAGTPAAIAVRAGFAAVRDPRTSTVEPVELMTRASLALERRGTSDPRPRIREHGDEAVARRTPTAPPLG